MTRHPSKTKLVSVFALLLASGCAQQPYSYQQPQQGSSVEQQTSDDYARRRQEMDHSLEMQRRAALNQQILESNRQSSEFMQKALENPYAEYSLKPPQERPEVTCTTRDNGLGEIVTHCE